MLLLCISITEKVILSFGGMGSVLFCVIASTVLQTVFASGKFIRVIESEPTDTLVKAGESVSLSCRSSHPWFLCLWVHPTGKKACSIQEEGFHRNVCSGLEDAEVNADGKTCTLELRNLTSEDHGEFMCLFSQAGVFHTDRKVVNVEVATPVEARLVIPGIDEETKQLRLLEDETVEVECIGEGGNPSPEYQWFLAGVPGKTPVHLTEQTINGSSFVNYTASLADSNGFLVCLTLQKRGDEIIYSSRKNISLAVIKAEPLYADFAVQNRILTGIFTGSILVILCIIAFIVFFILCNYTF